MHWGGWYEASVFGLTKAIVDENRFEIDTIANQTSDRAYYNGHYYSEKSPCTSFMVVPIYAIWKSIYLNVFPEDSIESFRGGYITSCYNRNVQLIEYINPGIFQLTLMLFLVVLQALSFRH